MQTGQQFNFNNGLGNQFIGDFLNKIDALSNHSINSINFVLINNILEIVLIIYSIFFIILITYSIVRMTEIKDQEQERLKHKIERYADYKKEQENKFKKEEELPKNLSSVII